MKNKHDQPLYDFYYSPKYKDVLKEHSNFVYSFINGNEYTEMISKGVQPLTHWYGDLIKVFTGTGETLTSRKH